MRLLAYSISGTPYQVEGPLSGFWGGNFSTIGGTVSSFLNLSMIIASILLVSWFSWGVFQYIFAGGDKNKLASARKRIIYTIFGFFMIALAFLLKDVIAEIFPNQVTQVQPIIFNPQW